MDDNIPADVWYEWLAMARRLAHNERVKEAIASMRSSKKKRPIQMPMLPGLDDPPSDQEDDESRYLP